MSRSPELFKITPSDSAEMSALYGDHFGRQWATQEIHSLLNQPCSVGYKFCLDGKMVGFILGVRVASEAEIYTIFVDAGWRRSGMGKSLLKAFMSESQELEQVSLEVAQDNLVARRFYERLGFVDVGVRQKYYKKTNDFYEDAVVMSLRLDNK